MLTSGSMRDPAQTYRVLTAAEADALVVAARPRGPRKMWPGEPSKLPGPELRFSHVAVAALLVDMAKPRTEAK